MSNIMPPGMTPSGFTMDMYLTLTAALASGAKSVYYGDKRVEYKSNAEMEQVWRRMRLELGLETPQSGRAFATYRSGLEDCGSGNGLEGSESPFDKFDSSYSQWK